MNPEKPQFDLGIFLSRQVKWVAPVWGALQAMAVAKPELSHVVHESVAPIVALAVFFAAHFDYKKFDAALTEWRNALPENPK